MTVENYEKGSLVFGDWKIVEDLGSGSYGTVYKIEKTEYGITTHAALKVIRIPKNQSEVRDVLSDGMDEKSVTSYFQGMVDSLVREIAVMSTLKSHPNIVSYENHKVEAHPGTIGWDILIQMELLTPLREYQKEHPMPETDVRRLAVDMCSALVFCQKKALIHRDIKPQNIFVSEAGQFKLGDFGVARTMDKTVGSLSKQGTEDYMAPEVYRGQKYGPSVDLYSLGLVLYRLMNNNRLPFMPPAPRPIGFGDRLNALSDRIGGEKPMLPPCNASPEFSRIILKACAHDPRDRYQTAAEMLEALNGGGAKPTDGEEAFPEPKKQPAPDDREKDGGADPRKAPEDAGEAEDDGGTIGPFGPRKKPADDVDEDGGTIGPFRDRTSEEHPPVQEPEPEREANRILPRVIAGAVAGCAVLACVLALVLSGGRKETADTGDTRAESISAPRIEAPAAEIPSLDSIKGRTPSDVQEFRNGAFLEKYKDENGNENFRLFYDADGALQSWYYADYDSQDQLTRHICFDGNSAVQYTTVWRYDENGNLMQQEETTADGSVVYRWEAQRSDTGSILVSSQYGRDGSLESRTEFDYDAQGTCLGWMKFDSQGIQSSWLEYTYRPSGNKESYVIWDADGSHSVGLYDDNGNVIEYSDYNADGTLNYREEATFDADGNRLTDNRYRSDGTLSSWYEYSYDADGSEIGFYSHASYNDSTTWYEKVRDLRGRTVIQYWYWDDGGYGQEQYLPQGMIASSSSWTADGRLSSTFEYSFDALGNKTASHSCDFNKDGTWSESWGDGSNTLKRVIYAADGSVTQTTEWEYDDQGNTTAVYTYDADGKLSEEVTSEYDSQGNRTKRESCWYESGSVTYWSADFYDTDGNTIKSYSYNPDGTVSAWYEYEYDAQGNQTVRTTYNADGSPESVQKFVYDAQGKQTQHTVQGYENGALSRTTVYDYDSDGNNIQSSYYTADGTLEYKYVRTFDENSREISQRTIQSDGTVSAWYEYEYDAQGHKIKESSYDSDGNLLSWHEYQYDTAGNRIEDCKYQSGKTLVYRYTYSYDANGRQTAWYLYDKNGALDYWYEYVYDENGHRTDIRHEADE